MNTLQAGFSRVDVTPMLGIGIAGYYKIRKADGVLDNLEAVALALSCDDIHKSGLTFAVGTDEADVFTLQQTEGCIFQNLTCAETVGYLFYY